MTWIVISLASVLLYIVVKNTWRPLINILCKIKFPFFIFGSDCIRSTTEGKTGIHKGKLLRHCYLSFFVGAFCVSFFGLYVGRLSPSKEFFPKFYWTINGLLLAAIILLIIWIIRKTFKTPSLQYSNVFRQFILTCFLTCSSFVFGYLITGGIWYFAGKYVLERVKGEVIAAGYHLDPPANAPKLKDEDNAVYWVNKSLEMKSARSFYSLKDNESEHNKPYYKDLSEREFLGGFMRDYYSGHVSAEKIAFARKLLSKHADTLHMVDKAYAVRNVDWKIDYSLKPSFEFNVPLTIHLLYLSRLVLCRAIFEARDGKTTKAFKSIRTAVFLGNISGQSAGILGSTIEGPIISNSLKIMRSNGITKSNGDEIKTIVLPFVKPERILNDFYTSTEFDIFFLSRYMENMHNMWNDIWDNENNSIVKIMQSLYLIFFHFDNAARIKDDLNQLETLKMPYSKLDAGWNKTEEFFKRSTWIGGCVGRSSYSYNIYKRTLADVSYARLAHVAIEAEIFRTKFRRWPRTVRELAVSDKGNYADPFNDGADFIIKPTKIGILIYSIGPDGKDDKGIPEPWKKEGPYDLVWAVNN